MFPPVSLILVLFCFPSIVVSKAVHDHHESFENCLWNKSGCLSKQQPPILHSIFSKSYWPILLSTMRNLRFNFTNTRKPFYIITPENYDQVKRAVVCTKKYNIEIRTRSGGHDYEGQSLTGPRPFVLLDLQNLRKVDVNVKDQTAWVQAGATLGELYYYIAQKSKTLGFPAGVCPTVGVGGHISGGGQGTLSRKYGLAADNVVDALIVDVKGRLLDKKKMGKDVFWAIRGGGAANFGVVVAWKIKLVEVPQKVTVFTVRSSLEEGATQLVAKWQKIAYRLPEDLFVRLHFGPYKNKKGDASMLIAFRGLYLGTVRQLLPVMKKQFPEMGLKASHCQETTWIGSVLYFAKGVIKENSTKELLNWKETNPVFQKPKSDIMTKLMPESALKKLWRVYLKGIPGVLIMTPYGGKMSSIPEHATPFPHRAGTLFSILYLSDWNRTSMEVAKEKYGWLQGIYKFMGDYASKPRTSYLNYKDLDLGKDYEGIANYTQASTWGQMYFKNNFKKLAEVKYRFDPENYFKNEQSIPPLEPYSD
ncbi:berberine bridge enzyme-like Cyn d 4 [Primulina eburnea]|uniref:berberine bridge enzyme-like Cyn d 4 n=1 Tax=Primulina eburnea TaxID=1245227 RepID=UPI003C6BE8A2